MKLMSSFVPHLHVMKSIKRILFSFLSQQTYLLLLHRGFYFLYAIGWLKKDYRYKYHYAIKSLIEPDFTVVDIGANLGYFAKNFARLTPKGKVICIEPVPQFYAVLKRFLSSFSHVTIHNVALGTEEGIVTMVFPETDGMIRTGLPHIASSEAEKKEHRTQDVPLVQGSKLLGDLSKIDYIKCDIEGYEFHVFSEIKPLVEAKRPYVQIEIDPQNLDKMLAYFSELNYLQYGIASFRFIRESGKQQEHGDYFFVPFERSLEFETKMSIS